jgi:hypothetical protein
MPRIIYDNIIRQISLLDSQSGQWYYSIHHTLIICACDYDLMQFRIFVAEIKKLRRQALKKGFVSFFLLHNNKHYVGCSMLATYLFLVTAVAYDMLCMMLKNFKAAPKLLRFTLYSLDSKCCPKKWRLLPIVLRYISLWMNPLEIGWRLIKCSIYVYLKL